ncbi:hypothetical protein GPLA_1669 [Paraglaciecola polaris LMG 21857]|uniref:Uncharacterized protein n=1 Tax=Paraglaciecola polaris LMG 21857 TaxID=1129793 RepID=K6ZUW2_9ALTE|nr:hypothetical protein GPLA_1669 [Paraglaciecola polaris LMG 21857]
MVIFVYALNIIFTLLVRAWFGAVRRRIDLWFWVDVNVYAA